jgi:aspartyl-tRNA(Asn)/glutamyl-tRNA(Gln) amidotransferase subunit C
VRRFDLKISLETVEYVAGLARLNLSDKEKEMMVAQMGDILDYMDKLNALETKGVKPLEHVEHMSNVFRGDSVEESFDREKILANAPDKDSGAFRVPKIVE